MDVLFKIAVITLITFNLQLFGRSQPQHDPVNNKDSSAQLQFKTEIIDAQFNSTLYIKNVSLEQQYLFVYSYSETNKTTAVRISASSKEADGNFPITFVVRQQEGILSWQVPVYIDYVYKFQFVDRTLCPMDKTRRLNMTTQQHIFVDVATMSNSNISFSLMAKLLPDFELVHDVTRNVTTSPSQPQYYMYTFPEDVDTVLLKVTSDDNLCAVVSVQQIKCPVMDLDNNIGYGGKHQTMTTQAAMFLQKSNYQQFAAFYVVIVVKPINADCSVQDIIRRAEPESVTSKNLSIVITRTIPRFYIVAAIIGCIYHGCGCHRNIMDLTHAEKEKLLGCTSMTGSVEGSQGHQCYDSQSSMLSDGNISECENQLLTRSQLSAYGSIMKNPLSESNHSAGSGNMEPNVSTSYRSSIGDNDDELDTSDVDFLPDADFEKDVLRAKTVLYVSDLARKSYKRLSKTFKVYHWNLITIAIFYGLPVAQLVLTYQQALLDTGNDDLCYYNFDCAHPIHDVSAFNNIISNMGYVLLGLLFFILVWRRDLLHRKLVVENPELERCYGIPQHYGLLYAMGLALIMEGVTSACYHVCPSYSNFQFDTSFMYIIACLCMLKIYETRHPDVQAKAYKSYFSMALLIFIAVLGVVYGSNIFWIFYALVHMLSSLVLSAQIYYVGRIKLDRYIVKRLFVLLASDCFHCIRPTYPTRFLMLFVGNVINWTFALYGAIVHPMDFASFLLGIFIGNLLLYLLFYILMKLVSGEKINLLTVLCIVAASITWAFALYFFFHHLSSWKMSPALSREKNRPCVLLDFYDAHDVWHFLSAISMFFSFLILLTLDDDITLQPRNKIPVF
ncbi:SID1 transmembrane family member 1-like isoform X2 [Pomacea canaliculata]|uniref:SID1 transmembrane family member 1-like isoform X2 n=1 Tax=Pomacea canaliculata TaxID=400727 RepID=UPI000D728C0B|nr:SID1 transmembrane family member 1-like isoform X2 [Pomacea canaliculata]